MNVGNVVETDNLQLCISFRMQTVLYSTKMRPNNRRTLLILLLEEKLTPRHDSKYDSQVGGEVCIKARLNTYFG